MFLQFLDLPPEIRRKIYIELCSSPQAYVPVWLDVPVIHEHPSCPAAVSSDHQSHDQDDGVMPYLYNESPSLPEPPHPLFPRELLSTCSRIYHELRPLYFSVNAFSIVLDRHTDDLAFFLAPVFKDNRMHIKTLRIILRRWGARRFFVETFLPVIEDMILNGSLRDLEVIVPRAHGGSLYVFTGSNTSSSTMLDKENWLALTRVCKDPYLDRVRLYTSTTVTIMKGDGEWIMLKDDTQAIRAHELKPWAL